MGRKSSVKSLPPEVLAEVNRLLGEDLATLDEIVAHLADLGHDRSRSALGRYKQNFDEVADKLRRSREMADALVKEIGPSATEGKTGRLLVEILQSLAFDFLLKRAAGGEGEEQEDMAALDFARLGKAFKDMASAQKIDVDRELKIRQETAKRMLAKLDEAAGAAQSAGEAGLSAERLKQLRHDFLGVRDAPNP